MSITRNLSELVKALQEKGYPTAQMQWHPQSAPPFPYCTLIPLGTDNIFSDDGVIYSPVPYELNVFSETRDFTLEKDIQALLESLGIPWQRDNYMNASAVCATYQITLIEE